ncbi:MAG: hypothetical protein R3C26_16300 [Calditrichia bacterium]
MGGAMRFSHVVNQTTFWDITARAKKIHTIVAAMVCGLKDLESCDDAEANALRGITLPQGDEANIVGRFPLAVFFMIKVVFSTSSRNMKSTHGLDFNMTKQFDNHLLEVGATGRSASGAVLHKQPD